MRVTFFVNNYAPSRGGVQEHVGQVARRLVRDHGMTVDVVTSDALLAPGGPQPGRAPVGDEVLEGVSVHRRPVARRLHAALRALRRIGRRLGVYEPGPNTLLTSGPLGVRLAVEARRLARSADVVVGVTAPTASLWAAGALTRRSRAAVVAMPLVHLDSEQPRPWVLRLLRRCHGVSANSGVERDWLEAHGVRSTRIRVLPPGCEPERFPDLTPAAARSQLGLAEAPTVGFIGRLAAHKGVDVLVAAMGSVWSAHPDAQLLVAGHEAGADLQRCLESLSPSQRAAVHVWGPFEDDDRASLLAACDVVAHPSRSESFGMVTVEAWCARRPVVVADIDVTRTLVHDGRDGRLVAVGDPSALADALSSLLDDATARSSYGAEGRRRAEQEFSWDAVVKGWAELLSDSQVRARDEVA